MNFAPTGPGTDRQSRRACTAQATAESGEETMAPPKGTMSAAEGGQQMAFRRARSSSGNANAEQARQALAQAFQAADIDRSGMIGV